MNNKTIFLPAGSIIKEINDQSKGQNATCMYTTEELATFSGDKLQSILMGIIALGLRPQFRPPRPRAKLQKTKRRRRKVIKSA